VTETDLEGGFGGYGQEGGGDGG